MVSYFVENFNTVYFYSILPFDNIFFDELTDEQKKKLIWKLAGLIPLGRNTTRYWTSRGWSISEARYKKSFYKPQRTKYVSPFSREFYTSKGYTIEEADQLRNSKRPIRKEYWMAKGYSEEDAIIKALETKNKNNKAGGKTAGSRSIEDHKKYSHRCKEYWILRGYSEKDAIDKVSVEQSTFSLEKCISKYGEEDGFVIWKNRQDQWQNTLNAKTPEEKADYNKRKNFLRMDLLLEGVDVTLPNKEKFDILISRYPYNTSLFNTVDELIEYNKTNHPFRFYTSIPYFKSRIAKTQINWFSYTNQYEDFIKKLKDNISKHKIYMSKYGAWNRSTNEGLLRSSYEIVFYDKIKTHTKNIKVGRRYSNSPMFYDFLIDNSLFIEIAPLYGSDEIYTQKMDYKKETFGSFILTSHSDIDKFINSYLSGEFNECKSNIRTIDDFC